MAESSKTIAEGMTRQNRGFANVDVTHEKPTSRTKNEEVDAALGGVVGGLQGGTTADAKQVISGYLRPSPSDPRFNAQEYSKDPHSRDTLREKCAEAAALAGELEAEAESEALRLLRGHGSSGTAIAVGVEAAGADTMAKAARYYSLSVLRRAKIGELPIEFAHKERYLSDADFAHVFGCDRAAFEKLPAHQQQAMKREHNLL